MMRNMGSSYCQEETYHKRYMNEVKEKFYCFGSAVLGEICPIFCHVPNITIVEDNFDEESGRT